MQSSTFIKFDPARVPSPCFVIDEVAIERNLSVLNYVQEKSGAKVLAALKAFSCWHLAPLVNQYLSGICASGYHEARLGYEEYTKKGEQGEVHVFSAAFSQQEFDHVLPIANHIMFNSFSQWEKYKAQGMAHQQNIQFGLRINPQHSEGTTEIYDPCAAGSRLGIPISEFASKRLEGISGLHFHTLCEQGLEPLRRTLAAVEEKFSDYLSAMQWINFGGGHHISHPDYDVEGLIKLIKSFAKKYNVQVYLEPGEAIAIRSGVLVSEVLDVMHTDRSQAILDTSATCHMPDTLEMPYRPDVFLSGGIKSGEANQLPYNYRLGGMTCLAGDVISDYSFEEPLQVGDRLMFDDMAHYTMVKTNTFNGIRLPAIAIWNSKSDKLEVVKQFDYDDFKNRLS
ncbi:putative carboxynorspermidine decarboxylase [gamma proteobacterium IMCC1989]|nr:putative carboxynorspermidine decarboxylase [gamma proteobacterium IMCC1989]